MSFLASKGKSSESFEIVPTCVVRSVQPYPCYLSSMLTHNNDSCFMQNVLRVVQIKGFVRTLERTDFPLLGEFDWISCFEKKYSWNCCHTVYSKLILDLDFRLFFRTPVSQSGLQGLAESLKVLDHNIQQHSAKNQLIWSEKELIDDIVYYHIYIQCYFDLECTFVQWDSRIRNFFTNF